MKKVTLLLASMLATAFTYAQGPAGLVAHWDMNGSVSDVSGGGHNGHPTDLVPAAGPDGIMGHGYYFNGTTSMITVPYSPAFNITKYSICATVKVLGYNTGNCQHNCIFTRGNMGTGTGNYLMSFVDDFNCLHFDSTTDFFLTQAEFRNIAPGTSVYTPAIVSNTWYKVVCTFDQNVYKTYVNGVLMSTAPLSIPGVPLGSSTDSVSIGLSAMDVAAGYPYPFKGVMDDVLLYDRPLTDSEAVHYGDSCGHITVDPISMQATMGSTVSLTFSNTVVNPVYQWQHNSGAGFVNIAPAAPYSGVTTNVLTITGVTAAMIGTDYRCIVSNSWGCADTTANDTLFAAVGINDVISAEGIVIVPNPAVSSVSIQLPTTIGAGHIELINTLGQVVATQLINNGNTTFNISQLPSGIYVVAIHYNQQIIYKKLQKL